VWLGTSEGRAGKGNNKSKTPGIHETLDSTVSCLYVRWPLTNGQGVYVYSVDMLDKGMAHMRW
jgi:hypothetical protein